MTDALVALFKRAFLDGSNIDEFAALMKGMLTEGTDIHRLAEVLDSPELGLRLGRAAGGLGDEAASELYKHIDGLVASGKTSQAKYVVNVMGSPTLSPQTVAAIKALPVGQRGNVWSAIAVIGRRLDGASNGVDARTMETILNNPRLVGEGFTHADLLDDMVNVLEKSPDVSDGFQTLAKRLVSTNPSNAKGALYERTVASRLIDDGFEGAQVVKVSMISKLVKTTEGGTDLDIVVKLSNGKRVIVQAKAGDVGTPSKAHEWVGKANSYAKAQGWADADYIVAYSVPPGVSVSQNFINAVNAANANNSINPAQFLAYDLAFPH